MPSRERVGARIRSVRTLQNKTLRDVENASGFSSTHISEIERGRTSPTIGALIRIANALEKDPSYFIEDRELDEVFVTSPDARETPDPRQFDVSGHGIEVEALTRGILGGRIQSYELGLDPGAEGAIRRLVEGADVFVLCLSGVVEMVVEDRPLRLEFGSHVHGLLPDGFIVRNPGEDPARLVIIYDPGSTQS